MKLVFCFTGKTFKGPLGDIVEDYRGRISKWAGVEVIEMKKPRPQSRDGLHIVLCPSGRAMSSEEFAQTIHQCMENGTKHLFFYTGGPTGISEEIMDRADMSVSFSTMTFNHQLIRVLLLEQVYRAFTIIRGEPYHK